MLVAPSDPFLVFYKIDLNGQPIYKLSDFGIARPIPLPGQFGTIQGYTGFVAPEVLEGNAYNQQADIYSLGVLMNLYNPHPQSDTRWTNLQHGCLMRDPNFRPFSWQIREEAQKGFQEALNAKSQALPLGSGTYNFAPVDFGGPIQATS
jgi:serine/threonine protein kinase